MAPPVNQKLRIGVIGLGMAGAMMIPHLARHPRAALGPAADADPRLRARFADDYQMATYADANSLLESEDVDAVYIATPHQLHREHAVLAASHGKHVIVEKPMALSLADCDQMIEAAHRNGVALIVGHTFSFEPAIREIARLAQSGSLGSLAMLAMWNYTDFLYRPRRPEELDTAQGGGILFNQIPHQVDIARVLVRSPVRSVRASTAILDPRRATEGCCMAFLDFENGACASIVYSGYDHFDSDEMHDWVSAIGRKKAPRHGQGRRALANLDERAEMHLRTERYGYGSQPGTQDGDPEFQSHFGTLVATFERADVRTTPAGFAVYSEEGMQNFTIPSTSNGRTLVLDELCGAVIDRHPATHDGRFAKGTVQACLAIQQSAQLRREIFLSI